MSLLSTASANLVLIGLTLSATTIYALQVVDLSYNLDENTIHWPTVKKYEMINKRRGWRHLEGEKNKDNFWYEMNDFCMSEHSGTHLDAPVHFAKGAWTVDEIPEDRLVAPVSIIDLRQRIRDDGDYLITVDDIQTWEEQQGKQIEPSSVIILWTGWSSRWPNRQDYFGFSHENDTEMHFPGLHPEAAEWLAQERGIYGIGIDTASIDNGQSTSFLSHRVLNSQNIYVLENVNSKDLDLVESNNALIVVTPLKIVSGSGSPVRLLLLLTDKIHITRPLISTSAAFRHSLNYSLILAILLAVFRLLNL